MKHTYMYPLMSGFWILDNGHVCMTPVFMLEHETCLCVHKS